MHANIKLTSVLLAWNMINEKNECLIHHTLFKKDNNGNKIK